MIIIVVHQKRESEKIIYMQLSKLTLVFLLYRDKLNDVIMLTDSAPS